MSNRNKEIRKNYIQACAEHKNLPIYFQAWWLDIVCGADNWTALIEYGHNKRVDGLWPIPLTKSYGLTVTRHPALTPFLGIKIFTPSDIEKTSSRLKFRQRITESLIEKFKHLNLSFFNQHFHEENNDLQNLFWNNFKQQVYNRYVISPIQVDTLLQSFDGDIRTNIKKANAIAHCKRSNTCIELYEMLRSGFSNSSTTIPYSEETLNALLTKIFETTPSKLIVAEKEGKIIGACLILIDKETAYLNCLGVNQNYRNSGISSLLIWEGIQFAAEHVNRFDFSGSMIPNISNFFRGFGGEKVNYNNVKWYKNKLVHLLHQTFIA